MKLIISLSLLLSVSTQANCLDIAKDYFIENGNSTDRPLSVTGPDILLAQEELLNERGHFLASFQEYTIIYSNTGSSYSGWFKESIVINPANCRVLGAFTIAAE